MSASVMAGIAGVKAAVGAMAACCRLRAAAPEATARAAVVAAMNFIAVCCGCLQQSEQAISSTAERPDQRSQGQAGTSSTMTRLCANSCCVYVAHAGRGPPPKLHRKAGSP